MMYVTVYIMSFNSNCRILAAELNYRFTWSNISTVYTYNKELFGIFSEHMVCVCNLAASEEKRECS